MIQYIIGSIILVGFISLAYIAWATRWVLKQEKGTAKMNSIAQRIAQGAVSFLRTEYLYISVVVALTSILLWLLGWYNKPQIPAFRVVNYIVGALLSAVAGIIGMRIATAANVRTAQAARVSLPKAFRLSFVGGAIMGIGVVAFALLGMSLLLLLTAYMLNITLFEVEAKQLYLLLEVLTGFALGTETIALFARVAGGIYTKAADVGADIVGKIEAGIPEDDPRNPATIADNVGDNVGDIAGMGADLFGSYISTLLAAMVLSMQVTTAEGNLCVNMMLLPLAMGALGLLVSLVTCFLVRLEGGRIQRSLNVGNLASMLSVAILSYPLLYCLLPQEPISSNQGILTLGNLYATILIGIVVSFVVSWITEYFTSMQYQPVQFIVKQSSTGPATNLIAGLSIGMFSTVIPMIIFAIAIVGTYTLASFYGVALAAVSMMSTTAIQLAIDAFGPIADNAGGIAEMSELPAEVRERTDALDAVGNTTAAAGKGFAIASAALTSLALFASFYDAIPNKELLNTEAGLLFDAHTLAGLLLGALVPFLFAGLIMNAVGKAAMQMVNEVRRQFRTIPGIMTGQGTPDYQNCIIIATQAALRQMFLPGILALGLPVIIGLSFGAKVLMAFLAGIVVVGTIMALFLCNTGGAWDNAKKAIEKSNHPNSGKGSPTHSAAVVGDTVGDPFKDTSGPAMNILIKLTIIVSLVITHYL